jgi:hypothetical protein
MRANRCWPVAGAVLSWCLVAVSSGRADPGSQVGADANQAARTEAFQIDGTVEGLEIRGPALTSDDAIRFQEVAGLAVTIRATPLDDAGNPVDGGRVIVLRPNETRVVRLAETLPVDDLLGRRLAIETIRGAGRVQVGAAWLTPEEAEAAAARPRVPRRRLTGAPVPPSEALIDQAESSGALDHETAVLYRVYAIFGDARLPAAYRGDDSDVFESLYLSTVVSEWATYSAATQATLKPFLTPPAYTGSWATAIGAAGAALDAHTVDLPPFCCPTCISAAWAFKENVNGNVRIWYQTAANDDGVAAILATTADTTIWPTYASFMAPHLPLSDAGASCDGGSGRLDVYLTDVARSFTQGHLGCSNTPAYIEMNRAAGVTTLAHEIFHAFQYSFQIGGCLVDANYRWWTEGSATWAEQYIYPNDQKALIQGYSLVDTPEQSLESVRTNIERVYGTFLVPFYVQNKTGSPNFVKTGWENCKSQDAIHAVDAAIPGGFAQTWHEIALRDFNTKPVDDYKTWRPLITYHANPQLNATVDSGFAPQNEFSLHMNLAHLSATYKNFFFYGPEMSTVAFFNGATQNLQKMDAPGYGPLWNPQAADPDKVKGVKVQAIIRIEGQAARVEDWTDKPYVTFCRDAVAERLRQLTIVISNARLDDSGGNAVPPGLDPVVWVSNMGCWKWKGSTHYSAQGNVSGSEVADSSDVEWTRTSATHLPPEITYQATGHLSITAGNKCSGSGTVTITPAATSLTTYNYTPVDAVAARAYVGASLEFNSIPVTCQGQAGRMMGGFWFNVPTSAPPTPPMFKLGADGKTMSGQLHDKTNGLDWTWNLTAQRE